MVGPLDDRPSAACLHLPGQYVPGPNINYALATCATAE